MNQVVLPVTDVPRLVAAITRIHPLIVYWGVRFSDKEVVMVRFHVRGLRAWSQRVTTPLCRRGTGGFKSLQARLSVYGVWWYRAHLAVN